MDQRSYANKLGYMLETPVYPLVLVLIGFVWLRQ